MKTLMKTWIILKYSKISWSFAVSIKGPMTRAMEPHDLDATTTSTFQSTGERQTSWWHHRQTETTQGNVWAGEETAALLESVNQPNKLPYKVGDSNKTPTCIEISMSASAFFFSLLHWKNDTQVTKKTPLKKPTQKKAMCFCFLDRITGK